MEPPGSGSAQALSMALGPLVSRGQAPAGGSIPPGMAGRGAKDWRALRGGPQRGWRPEVRARAGGVAARPGREPTVTAPSGWRAVVLGKRPPPPAVKYLLPQQNGPSHSAPGPAGSAQVGTRRRAPGSRRQAAGSENLFIKRGRAGPSDEDLDAVTDGLAADGASAERRTTGCARAVAALEHEADVAVDADRAGDSLLHLPVAALQLLH